MVMDEDQKKFVIPIGPQHPALKEPAHFELTVDGETVTGATARLGYAHRGIEKAVESKSYIQAMYMLERVCGICSHVHATAFAIGAEQLQDVTAPPRAQAIRVLVAEMERIHSHLLWLGVAAHEAGFDTLFMFTWRDRETIMDALESLAGNRVHYSANVIGGVKFDVTPEHVSSIMRAVDFLEERTSHYLDIVNNDAVFLQRTRGIGIMPKDKAEVLGVTGPTARASGVSRDLRIQAPYSGYENYTTEMILDDRGDLEARFAVRVRELFEAYRIIREILENLPPGDLTTRVKRRIPEAETVVRIEAPRGELFYFLRSNGSEQPDRVKVRTPTICNMASVLSLAVGHQLADVPMILVGVDPCFSCNDRMIQVRRSGHDQQLMTWDQLRRYGIEYYQRKAR